MTRWMVLVCTLAGCAQILGISDPSTGGTKTGGDAGSGDGNVIRPVCAALPFFPSPTLYSVPTGASDFALADVDGNGVLDLVVAAGSGGTLVFLGTGSGHFGASSVIGSDAATGVIVGDVDGQDGLDFVTWGSGSTVTVHRQTSFPAFTSQPFDAGEQVIGLIGGQFNRDGLLDLAIGNGSVTTWLASSTSPGTYTKGTVAVPSFDLPVAVADIDGDGLSDIAVTDSSGTSLYFNEATAPDTFASPNTIGVVSGVGGVFGLFGPHAAAPLLDLVAFDSAGDAGTLYTQTAARMFQDTTSLAVVIPSFASVGKPGIQAVDVNGDGLADIATVGSLAVQCADGTFFPGAGDSPISIGAITAPSFENVQQLVDLDGDGKPDLLQLDASNGPAPVIQISLQQ